MSYPYGHPGDEAAWEAEDAYRAWERSEAEAGRDPWARWELGPEPAEPTEAELELLEGLARPQTRAGWLAFLRALRGGL